MDKLLARPNDGALFPHHVSDLMTGESRNVAIDFASLLQDATITTATITTYPLGLTCADPTIDGNTITTTISGGIACVRYQVLLTVTASDDQVHVPCFFVRTIEAGDEF